MPLGFILMQGIDAREGNFAGALQKLGHDLGSDSSPLIIPSSLPHTEIPIPVSLHQKGFIGQRINGIDVIVPPMIMIPGGSFIMGSDKGKDSQAYDDETSQYMVPVGNFECGKYPVTVAEYVCFVQSTGHAVPSNMMLSDWEGIAASWRNKTLTWDIQRTQRNDHPVVGITWKDALAYTQWMAKVTKQPYRLLTEAEWEKGARGTNGRIYPWGNEWDKTKANTYEGGPGMTTPVGSYPQSASPYECLDMCVGMD
jgi:formylglycine-generating enzyme required for sulfatase activity